MNWFVSQAHLNSADMQNYIALQIPSCMYMPKSNMCFPWRYFKPGLGDNIN